MVAGFTVFESIYLVAFLAIGAIRGIYQVKSKQEHANTASHRSVLDRALVIIAFVSMMVLPLLYLFTPLLRFADYSAPDWMGWTGGFFMIGTIMLFWRAHYDLGRNFSTALEIHHDHELITNGIYGLIRHPMYTGVVLGGLGQLGLLHNWIVGPAMLVAGLLLMVLRIPIEERFLLDQFGDAYAAYQNRTGAVFPKINKSG